MSAAIAVSSLPMVSDSSAEEAVDQIIIVAATVYALATASRLIGSQADTFHVNSQHILDDYLAPEYVRSNVGNVEPVSNI